MAGVLKVWNPALGAYEPVAIATPVVGALWSAKYLTNTGQTFSGDAVSNYDQEEWDPQGFWDSAGNSTC